jgi:hypothetical protein
MGIILYMGDIMRFFWNMISLSLVWVAAIMLVDCIVFAITQGGSNLFFTDWTRSIMGY